MDADGKNVTTLGKGVLPIFSPDGKKILYTALDQPFGAVFPLPHLHVMDAEGKNDKKVVEDGHSLMGAWSPDGKHIAYMAAENLYEGQPHLYVANADGSDAKQLTKSDECELAPQWSADGKRVFFNRISVKNLSDIDKATICVIDADGKNEKALTKEGMDLLGGAGFIVLLRAVEKRKP
jgi:TolB protein